MRKRCLAWLALLLACCAPLAYAKADSPLLYNGDFSITSQEQALPAGWYFEAWTDDGETTTFGISGEEAAVYLNSAWENDARICQTVAVEPNTCYRISCEAKSASVQGGTGAAITVLDTFASSQQLFGDSEWETLALTGVTGPEQTELVVALRIGGYGNLSQGIAWFRGVSMERLEQAPADAASFAPMEYSGGATSGSIDVADASVFVQILLATAVVAVLFWVVYRREIIAGKRRDVAGANQKIVLLLGGGLLLRMLLSFVFVGHATDISCFMAWADAMAQLGPSGFYASGMFADYPPGYMYLLWPIGVLRQALGLSYDSALFVLLLKMPSILADLLSAYLVYRIAKGLGAKENKALLMMGVIAFHPVMAFVTGGWGQIDSLLTLCLVGVMLLFCNGKQILAGALYGAAILLKPQALMLGPLLAAAYILQLKRPGLGRKALQLMGAVAAAVGVILLLSLPFAPEPGFSWLLEKYFSTATSYPYASIEGFNLMALWGGNWKPVEDVPFLLSYGDWGTIFIALSVLAVWALYWRSRKKDGPGGLLLCAGFLFCALFTLGHFMHERYVYPALLLLLLAYLYYDDRRLFLCHIWFSCTLLLNALAAFVIVANQELRGGAYDLLVLLGSFGTVGGFVYLGYVCVDLIFRGRRSPSGLFGPMPGERHDTQKKEGKAAGLQPIVLEQERQDRGFHKKDRLYCWCLTGVYALIALLNLGSLQAPERYYYSNTPGETVTIRFEEPVDIGEYWVFGGIAEGTMLLRGENGQESAFEQLNTDMYRWAVVENPGFTQVQQIEVITYSGSLWINELAFFDAEGTRITPAAIVGPQASQDEGAGPEAKQSSGATALIDEQDIVPEYPSYFNGMYFDELYHARTAYEHLHGIEPYENSHPPLGKVFIMVGVAIFGMNPFGWRIMGALFGVGMVPVFYAFCKRLFGKKEYALVGAGLFAFDFMHFTQTRIATIDSFSVFFILLMYYFMYQYYTMSFYQHGLKATLRPLALAGLFFGLGAATKWICIYAGGGLAVILLLSLIRRYRECQAETQEGGQARPTLHQFWKNTWLTLLWCCLFYILVPVAIYIAAYLPYYFSELGEGMQQAPLREYLKTVWNYQEFMWGYHSGLTATHPYQSAWWQWPFTLKPMWYCWSDQVPEGLVSTLTASGNPAVWWVSTVGTIALAIRCAIGKVRQRPGMTVAFVGVCANFLPWVLVTRCTFIYHFFATVPFILLCALFFLWDWENKNPRIKWVKWAWLGLGILLFVLLYPGLSGLPVPGWYANIIQFVPGGNLMYGV